MWLTPGWGQSFHMSCSSGEPFSPALINAFRAALHCFFLFLSNVRPLCCFGFRQVALNSFGSFFPKRSRKKLCSQVSNCWEISEVDKLFISFLLKFSGISFSNSLSIFFHILSLGAGKLIWTSIFFSILVLIEIRFWWVEWQMLVWSSFRPQYVTYYIPKHLHFYTGTKKKMFEHTNYLLVQQHV